MDQQLQQFEQLVRSARTNGVDVQEVLGIFLIIAAIVKEFAVSDFIEAEAAKIEALADAVAGTATAGELVAANQAVANALEAICCIEEQINGLVDRGLGLLNGDDTAQ